LSFEGEEFIFIAAGLFDGAKRMKKIKTDYPLAKIILLTIAFSVIPLHSGSVQEEHAVLADTLVSRLEDWKLIENPLTFLPETLFEYINGAAEIYIAYDFQILTVLQFGREGSAVNLSAEIYEMSSATNAFGIYSAERFPDSTFIPVGVQGYIEEGALNCLIGNRYIKLICFDGGGECQDFLKQVASTIENISGKENNPPSLLSHFPRKGLLANSEKFILKNVLGYSFLHDGYFANYDVDGREFDCFLIEGQNEKDAQEMLAKYIEAKKEQPIQTLSDCVVIKDRYYKNVYLARVGKTICGVMKIEEEREDLGLEYLKALLSSLGE